MSQVSQEDMEEVGLKQAQGNIQSFKYARNLQGMYKEPEFDFIEQSSDHPKIYSNEEKEKIVSFEPLFLTDRNNQENIMISQNDQKQSIDVLPSQGLFTLDNQNGKSQLFVILTQQNLYQDSNQTKPKQDSMRQFIQLLRVKKNIKVFIDTLSERSYIILKRIQPKILGLLEEDYTKTQPDFKKTNKKTNQQSRISQYIRTINITQTNQFSIDIFIPGNNFLFLWEVILIIVTLLLLWWVPFRVCFDKKFLENELMGQYLIICFYAVDIFFKLNTGFFLQGQIVTKRKEILKHYFKGDAFRDISSFILLALFLMTQDHLEIIMCMFVFLGYMRLQIRIAKIQESFEEIHSQTEPFQIIKLIVMIFLIAHFIACLWHYVGIMSILKDQESWISYYGVEKQNIWTHYNYSIYWATMTMVTVGYGDITPKNDVELVTANIVMYIACGVFAFSVNSIGIILQNLNEGNQKNKRTLSILNNYLNKNGVSVDLQSRVRNYLDYSLQQESSVNDEAIQLIIGKLSKKLREELLYEVTSKALHNNKVISNNFCEETLKKVALLIETQNYCPDDKIVIQNQIDDQSLYIIQKGEVLLIEEQSNKNLGKLSKGETFGEWAFFTGQTRVCTIKSSDFTTVYKIKRENFLNIIKDVPNEFEKFHEIKDKLHYLQDFGSCNISCLCCDSKNHMITFCPKLLYIPDIERIIKKQMFTRPSVRRKNGRKNPIQPKDKNTLYLSQEIQKTQLKFARSILKEMSDINDSFEIGSHLDVIDRMDSHSPKSLENLKEELSNMSDEGTGTNKDLNKNGNNEKLEQSNFSSQEQSEKVNQTKSFKQRSQDNNHHTFIQQINTIDNECFPASPFAPRASNINKYKEDAVGQRKSLFDSQKQLIPFSQKLIKNYNQDSQSIKDQSKSTKKSPLLQTNQKEQLTNHSSNKIETKTYEIDLMMNFKNYFVEWNSDKICKKVHKQGRNKKQIPNQQENAHLSQYCFYFTIKKRLARLLRYLKIHNGKGFQRSTCKQQIILENESDK